MGLMEGESEGEVEEEVEADVEESNKKFCSDRPNF